MQADDLGSPEIQTNVQPCALSKEDVYAVAEQFAEKVGYNPGDKLEDVVAKLGGNIEIVDAARLGQSGSIVVKGEGQFTIYLPAYTGHLRDRFTIAHELGHYVLHSRLGETPIRVTREGSGRTEWEANWFAAAFLMPEKKFRAAMSNAESDAQLAGRFGVSIAAVEVRKQAIGG